MATAGYLISRAAEQPPILSLMVAVAAVQAFGIGRPIVRYLERLASHDLALRSLGRLRTRFYERIEPLAPAQLESYRTGDLLARMVGDVDAQQNLYLRGLLPPIVALMAGAPSRSAPRPRSCPPPGLVLAAGLLAGGLAVPALSGRLGGSRRAAPGRRARRAVGGARRAARAPRPSSSRFGGRPAGAGPHPRRRRAAREARPARRARDRHRRRRGPAGHRRRQWPECSPSRSQRQLTGGSTTC